MAYLFNIITDATFPSENYYVKGTSIENDFDIKGDLMVKVFDENDMNIAVFRQVKAVTAINEDMLTLNEIRTMLSPKLLVQKPIKNEEIVKVAPVQQSKKAEEPKRKGTEAVSVAGLHDEDFWATHNPSGGDLPTEENKEQDAKKAQKDEYEAAPAAGMEKAQKRKVIDHGKVMALKKAGWSGRKIAEEMKCSEQTICNIISQERKKVENGKI